MIRFLSFVIGITLLACSNRPNPSATQGPPNLILIIADDMGWDDCGAYGHPSIQTPHIDQLAKEGMRFDRAFLTTSSCSPSRASIITGKYPHNTDAEQLHWPLPAYNQTFVEVLKANGYWTALGGKYHLGEEVRDRFDFIHEAGTAGFQLSPSGQEEKWEGDGSGCESWVPILQNRPKDRPFFLWLAAVDPHRPYQDSIIARPHRAEEVVVPPYLPDTREVRADLAQYYDEISRLDSYVGKVMAELDQQGIADHTMILFITDNGRPFPRDKTTLYDGGIKSPWIVRWPDRVMAGAVCQALVSSVDIAPTFLKLAGLAPLPAFAGFDFSPLLQDPSQKYRDYIYAEDHWHDVDDFTRAIRTEQFKYIRNFYPELPNTPPADALRSPSFESMRNLRDFGRLDEAQSRIFQIPRPEEELYEIEKDPYELKNLARDPAYQKELTKMRDLLDNIRKQTKDELPRYRTPDEFDRETGLPLPNRKRPRPSKQEIREGMKNGD